MGFWNPEVSIKGCTRPEISRSNAYQFMLNVDDLTKIQVLYGVPGEFDLELSKSDARANNPPLNKLGVYEEAFKARKRFSIPSFLLDLLRFYNIFLYTIIPNSLG